VRRAWLGDGGGALAVANRSPFAEHSDSARELLADVGAALVSANARPGDMPA
jgi:hypothetical protein